MTAALLLLLIVVALSLAGAPASDPPLLRRRYLSAATSPQTHLTPCATHGSSFAYNMDPSSSSANDGHVTSFAVTGSTTEKYAFVQWNASFKGPGMDAPLQFEDSSACGRSGGRWTLPMDFGTFDTFGFQSCPVSSGPVDLTVAALRLKKLPWTVLPKRREFQFHYEMNAIADSDGSASTIVCFDATIVVSTSPIAVSLLGPLV